MEQNIVKNNLPVQSTSFIGRAPEIEEIRTILDKPDCRLLTLLGPGGIGKTRLALEVAAGKQAHFSQGVYFVDLTKLSDPANLLSAIINALGIYIGEDADHRQELLDFLSGRNVLLIMDNFEHLLDGVDLVADVLHVAPNVVILATSREVLNLQEEWVWQVRGMRYPDNLDINDVEQYSGLKLFLDRAQRVQRNFSPQDELSCVIRICQLVEGIPLALELSAAWLKTLTCGEIVKEIQQNIDFLATSARNVDERHRSIRAVFDYSWDLCTQRERDVFQKLCVFQGGFEREAAERVATASLITLSALVEKSMLWKLPSGRYNIHELLRQYAKEKLHAAGDKAAIQDAHMRYYGDFMETRIADIKGRRQIGALDEIEADFENLRTAWLSAVSTANYAVLDAMTEGLGLFCDMRTRYRFIDGVGLFTTAINELEDDNTEPVRPEWNRLRFWRVKLSVEQINDPDSVRQELAVCKTIAQEQGDEKTVELCTWLEIWADHYEHYDDWNIGRHVHGWQEVASYFREQSESLYLGWALVAICWKFLYRIGDEASQEFETARQELQDSSHAMGDTYGYAEALDFAGRRAIHIGRFEEGMNVLEDAETIFTELGALSKAGHIRATLGAMNAHFGNFQRTLEDAENIITLGDFIGDERFLLWGFSYQANISAIRGDYQESRQNLDRAKKVLANDPLHNYVHFIEITEAILEFVEGNFNRTKQIALRGVNNQLSTLRYVIDEAFVVQWFPVISLLLAQDEYYDLAIEILAFVASNLGRGTIIKWAEQWSVFTDLRQQLEQLPDYRIAWERGTKRSHDDIIDALLHYLRDDDEAEPEQSALVEALSEREIEVLRLVAEGKSNREIASELYLALGTVKTHIHNICGKLGAKNRTEATAIGREMGLL